METAMSKDKPQSQEPQQESLPLSGVRVVEFTHMVMGPTCGMILADLGDANPAQGK